MKLIDKDALVAEIKRKADIICQGVLSEEATMSVEYFKDSLISFIDTIEAKEVDLEKDLESWRHHHFHGRRDKEACGEYLERTTQLDIAKYFFELGMAVSNKAQKGEEV